MRDFADVEGSQILREEYDKGLEFLKGENKDYKKATTSFRKAAVAGNPLAAYRFAICLSLGLGGKKPDDQRAIGWLLKAVEAGVPDAIREYALCLINGFVVRQDIEKGIDYLYKAIDLGSSQAKVDLADFYMSLGENVSAADTDKIEELLSTALKEGNAKAANLLGVINGKGLLGFTENADKAFEYFKQAGELGLDKAFFNVAYMLDEKYKSDPTPELVPQIISYYEKAKNSGFLAAYQELIFIYCDQIYGLCDDVKAKQLFLEFVDECNKPLEFDLDCIIQPLDRIDDFEDKKKLFKQLIDSIQQK
jgi:TPR repeat protein